MLQTLDDSNFGLHFAKWHKMFSMCIQTTNLIPLPHCLNKVLLESLTLMSQHCREKEKKKKEKEKLACESPYGPSRLVPRALSWLVFVVHSSSPFLSVWNESFKWYGTRSLHPRTRGAELFWDVASVRLTDVTSSRHQQSHFLHGGRVRWLWNAKNIFWWYDDMYIL